MNTLISEEQSPKKLLLLDDSVFDRARFRRIINLAKIQYQIIEIGSLAELGKLLDWEAFDIAILDYDLPDGTGLDALRCINAHVRGFLPISIMVTGNDAPHIARNAMKLGCTTCLLKSELRPETLRQTINAGMNGSLKRRAPARAVPRLTVVPDH